jgi:hypothetical protein
MKVTSPLLVFFTFTLAHCILGQNDSNTDTIHYFRMYHLHSTNGALDDTPHYPPFFNPLYIDNPPDNTLVPPVREHPSIPLLPLSLTMSIGIPHGLYTYPTTSISDLLTIIDAPHQYLDIRRFGQLDRNQG